MNIIPDPFQVILNTVPFLVAVVGMYLIILRPMLGYLLERKAAIVGGHDEAARIEVKIKARMNEVEIKLEAARSEITSLRANKRAAAQVLYDAVIAEAQAKATEQITGALGEIEVARQAASAQLKIMSGEIAEQVAGQVLGRSITAGA